MRRSKSSLGTIVEIETQNFAPAPGIGSGLSELIIVGPAAHEVLAIDWLSFVVAPPPGAGAGSHFLGISELGNTIFTQGNSVFGSSLEYQYLGWQSADLGQLPPGAPAQQELVSKLYATANSPLQIFYSNGTDVVAGIGRFYIMRYRRIRL